MLHHDPFSRTSTKRQDKIIKLNERGQGLVNANFSRPLTFLAVTLLPQLLVNYSPIEYVIYNAYEFYFRKQAIPYLNDQKEAIKKSHAHWIEISTTTKANYQPYMLSEKSNPDEGLKWFQDFINEWQTNPSFIHMGQINPNETIGRLKNFGVFVFFQFAFLHPEFDEYFTSTKEANPDAFLKKNLTEMVNLISDAYHKTKRIISRTNKEWDEEIIKRSKGAAFNQAERINPVVATVLSLLLSKQINVCFNRGFLYLYRSHHEIYGKSNYLSYQSAEDKIVLLKNCDEKLRVLMKYVMAITMILFGGALIQTINKINNDEKNFPGLYAFILCVLMHSRNFYYLFKEEYNLSNFEKQLAEIHQFFNQAVDATGTQWFLNENTSIENSKLRYSADAKIHQNPRKINEIVKNAFFQNAITIKQKHSHKRLSARTNFQFSYLQAEAINDQILWKINKPQKNYSADSLHSTSTTLTQLKKMKGKSTLKSEQKYFASAKKIRDVQLPAGIQGKLITRKNSLMLIKLSDSNPEFTKEDLDALPDTQARSHRQSGVKILVKGSEHPFWVKDRSNKRVPLDEVDSETVLVDGLAQTVPTYIPVKQVKK